MSDTFYQDSRARVKIIPQRRLLDFGNALTGKTTVDPRDPFGRTIIKEDQDIVSAADAITFGDTPVEFDIREGLLDVDIHRRAASPGGAFGFNVKTSFDFLELLKPNDFVELYLDNGSGERLEMVGLIDRPQVNETAGSGGATTQTYTITGREAIGKVITATDVFYDDLVRNVAPQLDFSKRFLNKEQSTLLSGIVASSFVPELIAQYGGKDGQFIHPLTDLPFLNENSNLVDLKTYVGRRRVLSGSEAQQENDAAKAANIPTTPFNKPFGSPYEAGDVIEDDELLSRFAMNQGILPLSGKMWTFVNKWADRLFHTLYFDVLPDERGELKSALVFKQHPYDVDIFLDLNDHDVLSTETRTINVGRSDADLINAVKVMANSSLLPMKSFSSGIINEPFVNPQSINVHGIRSFYQYTMYPFLNPQNAVQEFGPETAAEKEKGLVGGLRTMARTLARWHGYNDLLMNGSIDIARLRNDIRLGDRVNYFRNREKNDGWHFLVEGIRHRWIYQGVSSTTVDVSRGIPLTTSDKYQKFVEAATSRLEQFESGLGLRGVFGR